MNNKAIFVTGAALGAFGYLALSNKSCKNKKKIISGDSTDIEKPITEEPVTEEPIGEKLFPIDITYNGGRINFLPKIKGRDKGQPFRLIISDNVTNVNYLKIYKLIFNRKRYLTYISVDEKNKYYSSLDGVLFNKDQTKLIRYPSFKEDKIYNIPDSVTSIGNRAFENCEFLTNVTIPNSVRRIGKSAFKGCSYLKPITIPDSVLTIGNDAVNWLGRKPRESYIETAQMSNHGESPFRGALFNQDTPKRIASVLLSESFTIPSSVIKINPRAFYNDSCLKLTNIYVDEKNNYFSSIDGVLFNKDQTKLIAYPRAKIDKTYEVPASVTSIEPFAFAFGILSDDAVYMHLKTIIIPDSVTSIGNIPVHNLKTITFSDSEVSFATIISFLDIKTILSQVTSIYDFQFMEYSLKTITIPFSIKSIGSNAFLRCTDLKTITFPGDSQLTTIGNYAFKECTSLKTITIPNLVTTIGQQAFQRCRSLKKITIPASVINIGSKAFVKCNSLTTILVDKQNKYYSSVDGVLFNKDKTILIAYPYGKSENYTIPSGVTSIGEFAFFGCSSLKNIGIPDSLTSIGHGAFFGCSGITSIEISSSTISIGDAAFKACRSLTSIKIPNSSRVTTIGDEAFSGCSSLKTFVIPTASQVTSIGKKTFYKCKSLKTFVIPDSVASIGDDAFSYCTSLETITIPTSVTSIGGSAFLDCASLTRLNIPSGVKIIGRNELERYIL